MKVCDAMWKGGVCKNVFWIRSSIYGILLLENDMIWYFILSLKEN